MSKSLDGRNARPPARGLALDQLVGYALKRAKLRLYGDLTRSLGDLGLRPVTFSVLATVGASQGLSQVAVGDALAIKRANFVGIALELETRGWITRKQDVADRRQYVVQLTSAGEQVLRNAWNTVREHEERVLADITPQDRRQLVALLNKIAPSEALFDAESAAAPTAPVVLVRNRSRPAAANAAAESPKKADERSPRRRRRGSAADRTRGPSRPP